MDRTGCLVSPIAYTIFFFCCDTSMGIIALVCSVIFYIYFFSSDSSNSNTDSNTDSISVSPSHSHIDSQKTIATTTQSQIKHSVSARELQELTSNGFATRLEITKNCFPEKKLNHENIKNLLLKNGVQYFYHFTDECNLDSIRKHGGLISWASCEKHHVQIPSAGGDELSKNLDRKFCLQDYVRLSFCKDHPMAYRLKIEGKRLVLLKIKIDVAMWNDTLFSNMNATDLRHSHGGSIIDLQNVRFDAVKKSYVSKEDEDFKYHQAEILVKTVVPIEFIVNLDSPEYL